MKFCENCGYKLEDEKSECPNCSNILLKKDELEELNTSKSKIANFQAFKKKYTLSELPDKKETKRPNVARLVVTRGGTPGREFYITNEENNIGRWDPNLKSVPEIDLSDEDVDAKVSRFHAKIIRKTEGYYIEDLGSRNGTFLNREYKLVPGLEYSLKHNDEVIIGHVFFCFEITD